MNCSPTAGRRRIRNSHRVKELSWATQRTHRHQWGANVSGGKGLITAAKGTAPTKRNIHPYLTRQKREERGGGKWAKKKNRTRGERGGSDREKKTSWHKIKTESGRKRLQVIKWR